MTTAAGFSVLTVTAAMLAALTAAPVRARADSLTLKSAEPAAGTFEEYDNARFHFQTSDGTELNEMRARVIELRIDPAAKVIVKPRGQKERSDLLFKEYGKRGFVFEENGKELTMPAANVTSIRMGLDFGRETRIQRQALAGAGEAAFDIEGSLRRGSVTIVHIHKPDDMASTRQGNYVKLLEEKYSGRVSVVVVPITSWSSERWPDR